MLTGKDKFALAMKKRFDYPLSPQTKTDHQKDGTDKNDTCEGGYAAPRRIATADAVPEKIAHSRLRSRFLRFKNRCYGEPSFCCAKSGSIIRSRPKQKQTIFLMVCFCLVGEGGFGPPKLKSNRFTVCPLWPLGNSPILSWSW